MLPSQRADLNRARAMPLFLTWHRGSPSATAWGWTLTQNPAHDERRYSVKHAGLEQLPHGLIVLL